MTRNKWREVALARKADEMLADVVRLNRAWRLAKEMGAKRVVIADGRNVRVVSVAVPRGV